VEVPLPDIVAPGLGKQTLELAHRQHVGKRLPFLRRPQWQSWVAHEPLLLDEEAEERLEPRGRPGLARNGRPPLLLGGEKGAQVGQLHLGHALDPLTLQVIQARRNVTLVRRTSHRGKPALRPAKAQEIGQFFPPTLHRRSSFGQPSGPRWGDPEDYPAYRSATEKALVTGLFLYRNEKRPALVGVFYFEGSAAIWVEPTMSVKRSVASRRSSL
jgi:hypothetical protein